MTTSTVTRRRRAIHPMKSPLATRQHDLPAAVPPHGTAADSRRRDPAPRAATLEEFADYLRTITNRDGRPFQPATVDTYVYAGRALDAWMSAANIDGDFAVVDTAMLNRFFRDYFRRQGQHQCTAAESAAPVQLPAARRRARPSLHR